MDDAEVARADLWATGVSPDGHPTRFVRAELDAMGVVPADRLVEIESGTRVLVGGVVTHRQRPATASGTTFVNLEDETGLINVICSKGCWARFRRTARTAPALLVRGRLEKAEGVINVVAERLDALPIGGVDEVPRLPLMVSPATQARASTIGIRWPTHGLACGAAGVRVYDVAARMTA